MSSLAALVLAGCDSTFGEKSGATKHSHGVLDLWRSAVMVAIVIGAIVVSLIIWCVLRYPRRGRDGIPSQRQYHGSRRNGPPAGEFHREVGIKS